MKRDEAKFGFEMQSKEAEFGMRQAEMAMDLEAKQADLAVKEQSNAIDLEKQAAIAAFQRDARMNAPKTGSAPRKQ